MPFECFWKVEDDIAFKDLVDTNYDRHLADDGESVMQTVEKRFPGSAFHRLILAPGQYYPRMARPISVISPQYPVNFDKSPEALAMKVRSTGQLHVLIQQLQLICHVIHPDPDNYKAYGHQLRNLLIIASTEAEAQWKGILSANGLESCGTKDYVLLSSAMKLQTYEVCVTWYP